jgi:hypothetical protein
MTTNDFGRDVEETVRADMSALGERIGPQVEEAKRRLRSLNGEATRVIKEHPAACLLAALGLGYLIARLARRQSS